jgi:hypothetical protein
MSPRGILRPGPEAGATDAGGIGRPADASREPMRIALQPEWGPAGAQATRGTASQPPRLGP